MFVIASCESVEFYYKTSTALPLCRSDWIYAIILRQNHLSTLLFISLASQWGSPLNWLQLNSLPRLFQHYLLVLREPWKRNPSVRPVFLMNRVGASKNVIICDIVALGLLVEMSRVLYFIAMLRVFYIYLGSGSTINTPMPHAVVKLYLHIKVLSYVS